MNRYRIFKRSNGLYFLEDKETRKQESLKTRDRSQAFSLWTARNQASLQPYLNQTMAKAYLSANSPDLLTKTWEEVMQNIVEGYQGETLRRWEKFMRSDPLSKIRKFPLVQSHGEHFLSVFRHPKAGVSTNKFLRILHNRALDLGWLLNPVLPKRAWPKFRYQSRRGITLIEHQKLVEAEHDSEYKLYYQFLWETGGSQTDIAGLHWNNIDQEQRQLSYQRKKLEGRGFCGAALVIGESLQRILDQLPQEGWLFPSIRIRREVDRASRFRKVRIRAGVEDVTLHGYRYAWAERAMRQECPKGRQWRI